MRQEEGEVNKKKQIRTLLRILTCATGSSLVPFTEIRSSGEVGLEESGLAKTRIFNPPLPLELGMAF